MQFDFVHALTRLPKGHLAIPQVTCALDTPLPSSYALIMQFCPLHRHHPIHHHHVANVSAAHSEQVS